jgi:hypothetical protein
MALIEDRDTPSSRAKVTSAGGLHSFSVDEAGNPLSLLQDAQPTNVAGAVMMGVNDRSVLPLRVDRFGSVATSLHTPLLIESFEGGTLHALRWLVTATTMAATTSTVAGLTVNSGAITTINTGYMLQSARRFLMSQRMPSHAKFRARMVPFTNSVMEIGFGDAATFNGANTTGAFFQRQSSGALVPVVTYNSVNITGTDIAGLLNSVGSYTFDIFRDDDEVTFAVQDTATGLLLNKQSIKLPLTGQRMFSSTALPILARVYNTGTAPATAPQMFLTDIYVASLDADLNVPLSDNFAMMNRSGVENPFTGAQLSTWANSAEPANATLSNTAAGYATLGGRFQFAAVAGVVTDYALFGFQVPVPANLAITSVDIDSWNLGAAVATTPTLLTWALGVGSTAVSLATATVRIRGVGAQSLPVGAAIGAKAERISQQFRTPLFCASGRFVHVILRIPVGTATASQVIAGMVNLEGYFV